MSAVTLITRNQESIYNELFPKLLSQGNKYLLYRDFALGKGWDKTETYFLYQYLNLLSNFSPDIDALFTTRLQANLKEEPLYINGSQITITTEDYIINSTATEFTNKLEVILKQFEGFVQDNISTTIYVSDTNLAPYSGTLEEKIALYINTLGYTKESIDSEIWVEYTGILWS